MGLEGVSREERAMDKVREEDGRISICKIYLALVRMYMWKQRCRYHFVRRFTTLSIAQKGRCEVRRVKWGAKTTASLLPLEERYSMKKCC